MFAQSELAFEAGLFSNRSARGSKNRWVDGNLVRFRDGVPAQMGGWRAPPVGGAAIAGRARAMHAWRPNSQVGRYVAIGTTSNAYVFDGSRVSDVTPDGFVAGRADTIVGAGFGAGPFGRAKFGTARATGGLLLQAGGWTFDMFGEVLLGCGGAEGSIYELTTATAAKMTPVTNAPKAMAICVSDERHVFAFGCDGNPSLVRWSDRENRNQWTPTATNRAGSYDMQCTSGFQAGRRVRGAIAAWTQTEAFAFEPLSNSLVYSQDRIGTNCGVMGPHAVAVVNDPSGDVAYWMAPHAFYVFDGAVRELACDLWDYVFKDINLVQRAKAHLAVNTAQGEIWAFYCSAASTEIDRAVVFSYTTGTWSKANIARLTWQDAGIFAKPLAIGPTGVIFEHEVGDVTESGTPLPSFVLSAPLLVGVGQQMAEIDAFWPDLQEGSGICALTLLGRDYAGGPVSSFGPYPFGLATEKVDLAVCARQVQIRIDGAAGPWELGVPILSVQTGSGR